MFSRFAQKSQRFDFFFFFVLTFSGVWLPFLFSVCFPLGDTWDFVLIMGSCYCSLPVMAYRYTFRSQRNVRFGCTMSIDKLYWSIYTFTGVIMGCRFREAEHRGSLLLVPRSPLRYIDTQGTRRSPPTKVSTHPRARSVAT